MKTKAETKANLLRKLREKYFSRLGYAPHDGQKAVHETDARFTAAVCGRRWGKSLMAGRELGARALLPGQRLWIVAPNYSLADKTFRVVWHDFVIRNKVPVERKSEHQRWLRTAWNSVIECKSAENPDSLVGEGLDYLVLDEAAKLSRDIWEKYLRPALSDRQGHALFISTPEGHNWMREIFQRGQSPEFPDWKSFRSPSWDNPFLSEEEVSAARRVLARQTFQQEFGAEFISPAHNVYADFSRAVHVIPYEFCPAYETYCAIDFGWQNPTAILWIQVDPHTENAYVFDEVVEPHLTTEKLARIILNRGYPVRAYYCDPAGNATQPGGENTVANLKKLGVRCKFRTDRLSRSVPVGVELVRGRLRNVLGESRLFFSDKLSRVVADIETYRYPTARDGEPAPEEPLKDGLSDHSMDALRYFMVNRFPPCADSYGKSTW